MRISTLVGFGLVCCAVGTVFSAQTIDGVTFRDNFVPTAVAGAGESSFKASIGASVTIGGTPFLNELGKKRGVVALDGAVLKPFVSDGAKRADMCFGLIVTNGTVTLDLTDLGSDVVFKFQAGLWVDGPGAIVVKGRDSLLFGCEMADSTSSSAAAFRAESLSFVDGSGQAYANPGGVEFFGYFCEIRMPTNVNWTVADGSTAIAYRTGAGYHGLYDRYVSNGAMTIDKFDFQLLDPVAFSGVRFTVNKGRQLRIFPRTIYFESAVIFNYNGNSIVTFDNDVVLNGGTFYHGNHYTTTHTGSVSGNGHFVFAPTVKQSGTSTTTFSGELTFTGDVEVSASGSPPAATLVFRQASPGSPGNSVSLGKGVTFRLEPTTNAVGHISSISTVDDSATLCIGSGLTLQLDAAPTNDVLTGVGSSVSTLLANWMPAYGEYVKAGPMSSDYTVLVPDGVKANTVEVRQGTTKYYVRPLANGSVDLSSIGGVIEPLQGTAFLTAVNGGSYQNVPSNVTVQAGSGVTASVAAAVRQSVDVEAAEGASVSVAESPVDWESHVSARFDFSTAEWTGYDPSLYPSDYRRMVDGHIYPVASNVFDVAGAYFLQCDKPQYATISPHVMTNACNGLNYLSFKYGGNCIRARLHSMADGSWTYISPKFAVMVFGSQAGGGAAVLADDRDGAYTRAGFEYDSSLYIHRIGEEARFSGTNVTKDYGLFGDDTISCWLDGTKVETPSEQPLSGGWQIISVDTSDHIVSGLGYPRSAGSATNDGGQNYAEVIFFDKVLNDLERIAVERYLAQKWGITSYQDSMLGVSMTLGVSGKGSVSLGKDTVLAPGAFNGTIDLNGKSLSFASGSLPPGSEAIPSPQNWFDPDVTSAVIHSSGTYVSSVFDWRDNQSQNGIHYLNSAGRAPKSVRGSRGDGPIRNWIDCSPVLSGTATASGRGFRFKEKGNEGSVYAVQPVTARTVVMAQDSSKNGGTPFLDTVAGNTLSPRSRPYATYGATTAADPIWRDNSVNVFGGGQTYLDGKAIDGTRAGFGGRPEILTAVGGSSFTLGAFGYVSYLDARTPNDIDEGEIQGEILVYNQVLSDADRKTAEAYLAWKWCGKAINGYACRTNLTLTGSGAVVVGDVGQMPKFDSSFVGTVSLPNADSLNFSVSRDTTEVAGALVLSGAAEFPSEVTVNVAYSGRPKGGEYVLVSAGSGLDNSTWTLAAVPGVKAKLVVTSTAVKLAIPIPGMVVSFH